MIAESLVDSSLITLAIKDIASLKHEITSLDSESQARINNLNALSVKLSELEKTVKRHDLEIGSLKEGIGSLNERVDAEVGSLNKRMNVEVGSLKRRIDTIQSSVPNKKFCAGKQELDLF